MSVITNRASDDKRNQALSVRIIVILCRKLYVEKVYRFQRKCLVMKL